MRQGTILQELSERFARAIATVAGAPTAPRDAGVRPAAQAQFGDYQCNAAMALAKSLGRPPRVVAEAILAALDAADMVEPPQIAGPGFINLRLTADALRQRLEAIEPAQATQGADRVGLRPAERSERVVIDYASPNIAKQMHVGHLRSTIIGDVFARVLEFYGHDVIRQNHVGDWGTQFGMLIAHYSTHPLPDPSAPDVLAIYESDYRAAQERFKSDEAFAAAARQAVTRLQGGDAEALDTWRRICALSRDAFSAVYRKLSVSLTDEHVRGESFYNERLASVVEELRRSLPPRDRSLPAPPEGWVELRTDQGAECLFFYDARGEPRYRTPEGGELPTIVRKSDGAFLYATTDLAALRYRLLELRADRVVYVTDSRQKLHFEMLFATARAAGWLSGGAVLEHAYFGSVLGSDRRPLKTRSGDTPKLRELLDLAVGRAEALMRERHADGAAEVAEAEIPRVAEALGVAAVKYADLSSDRTSDYVFDESRMLSMKGNTAPYLFYACVRAGKILHEAATRLDAGSAAFADAPLRLDAEAERALALRLARFGEALENVSRDLTPHLLCAYLYELASDVNRFYEECPVLSADSDEVRRSRLRLCSLVSRTLRSGLGLLGLGVVERM